MKLEGPPSTVVERALKYAQALIWRTCYVTCRHERFEEVLADQDGTGELVLARCLACGHDWAIAQAEHCEPSERPRKPGFFLPGCETFDPASQVAPRQDMPGCEGPSPMCAEVSQ